MPEKCLRNQRGKEAMDEFGSEEEFQDDHGILDKPTSSGELGAKKKKAVACLRNRRGKEAMDEFGSEDEFQDVRGFLDKPISSGELGPRRRRR